MLNAQSPIEKYPLLPYSQLVFDMLKSNPDVYWSCFGLRLDKKKVEVGRFKQAIEKAIRNHPVFQMHVDEEGMQHFEPIKDILHGQYHSVDFIDNGESVDVYIKGNRILGDGWSDAMIVKDVVRAYQGLPLQPDGYLEFLQQVEEDKYSARYAANQQWLESEYGHLSCPVHPKTDFPIQVTDTPIEGTYAEDYSAMREVLDKFASDNLISRTGFFSLVSALAMMEYNDCDEAALTWAYDGRERPEEQRIYGSLHRDIPFKISNLKSDLIRQARNQIRSGIAHSCYPFTLTYPHTEIWNYALNVLVQLSMQEKTMAVPFPFEDITPDIEPHNAYSLMDVEIIEMDKLIINYRYSASHYKPASIQRFAALVRKYAECLLE